MEKSTGIFSSLTLIAGLATIIITLVIGWFMLSRLTEALTTASIIILIAISGGIGVLVIGVTLAGLVYLFSGAGHKVVDLAVASVHGVEKSRRERVKTDRHRALAAQEWRKAEAPMITTAPPGHQIFKTEAERLTTSAPLHLTPGPMNGTEAAYSPEEADRWQMNQLAHSTTSKGQGTPHPLIETPALPPGDAPIKLPEMIPWRSLLPAGRGDLDNLILGMRIDEATNSLKPVTISLYNLFHTIAVASSGWGKSVFANSILAQLATCAQGVELVAIDQQDHGLAPFRNCDRLRYPLLRQPREILDALQDLHHEATVRRSSLFEAYDATDLKEYNQASGQYLPPVVVAVDEASSLLTSDKEVAAEFKRQTWELRKFGIYQILLMTSAKGTAIDTDHRQQFSSKVQMHANDRSQARLLMDAPQATAFPPGRALIELPGQSPTEVQTPFIHRSEVRNLLRVAEEPPAPPPVLQPPEKLKEARRLWTTESKRKATQHYYGDWGGPRNEALEKEFERWRMV